MNEDDYITDLIINFVFSKLFFSATHSSFLVCPKDKKKIKLQGAKKELVQVIRTALLT